MPPRKRANQEPGAPPSRAAAAAAEAAPSFAACGFGGGGGVDAGFGQAPAQQVPSWVAGGFGGASGFGGGFDAGPPVTHETASAEAAAVVVALAGPLSTPENGQKPALKKPKIAPGPKVYPPKIAQWSGVEAAVRCVVLSFLALCLSS